jgi:hypothetical protein
MVVTELMKFLNDNATGISAIAAAVSMIATIVLAITTIVYARSTAVIAEENRLLRKAGTEPDIAAYLIPHPVHLVVINLVVANVGQGPAYDVEIEFDADPADFADHNVRYQARQRRRIASVLPQGERYVQVFGAGEDLFKGGALRDFTIVSRFKDARGNQKSDSVVQVSIKDFEGYGGFEPPDYEIAKAIKKLTELADNWSSGFKRLKVETLTQAEQIEINKRQRDERKRAKEASERG